MKIFRNPPTAYFVGNLPVVKTTDPTPIPPGGPASDVRSRLWRAITDRGIETTGQLRSYLWEANRRLGVSDWAAALLPHAVSRRLTTQDIGLLVAAFPEITLRDWFEDSHRVSLARFLGTLPDGLVDYRLPEGMTWEALEEIDGRSLLAQRLWEIFMKGGDLPSTLCVIDPTYRKELRSLTLEKAIGGLGEEGRFFFLFFRRRILRQCAGAIPGEKGDAGPPWGGTDIADLSRRDRETRFLLSRWLSSDGRMAGRLVPPRDREKAGRDLSQELRRLEISKAEITFLLRHSFVTVYYWCNGTYRPPPWLLRTLKMAGNKKKALSLLRSLIQRGIGDYKERFPYWRHVTTLMELLEERGMTIRDLGVNRIYFRENFLRGERDLSDYLEIIQGHTAREEILGAIGRMRGLRKTLPQEALPPRERHRSQRRDLPPPRRITDEERQAVSLLLKKNRPLIKGSIRYLYRRYRAVLTPADWMEIEQEVAQALQNAFIRGILAEDADLRAWINRVVRNQVGQKIRDKSGLTDYQFRKARSLDRLANRLGRVPTPEELMGPPYNLTEEAAREHIDLYSRSLPSGLVQEQFASHLRKPYFEAAWRLILQIGLEGWI